ncbi:P-loop containing nucleoside triphosphate hydrolase protein [Stipitochalara longipes BDJ]|nr:P-loop containing nucleoside triphosphate hydrolase protein [Stipitochalara longipes BDJ]
MSVLVERSMGVLNEERKPVYPLFQKGAKPLEAQPRQSIDPDASISTLHNAPEPTTNNAKRPMILTPAASADTGAAAIKASSSDRVELLDVDPNSGRKKRRKTAENKAGTEGSEDQAEMAHPLPKRQSRQTKLPGTAGKAVYLDMAVNTQSVGTEHEGVEIGQSVIQQAGDSHAAHHATETRPKPGALPLSEDSIGSVPILPDPKSPTKSAGPSDLKPKKILRLNPKTGTIGSPPAKKPPRTLEPDGKKAPASKKKVKSKVIIIRYNHGRGVGQKITEIINSTKSIVSLLSKVLPDPPKPPAKPPKTLHPLFLGKVAAKKENTSEKTTQRPVIDLSRARELTGLQSRDKSSPTKPASVAFSGFGAAKLIKYPGAVEPAWPWKDMVHIRGLATNEAVSRLEFATSQIRRGKFKYQAIEVLPTESIIGTLAKDLCLEKVMKEVREINPDEYPAIPASLRIPTKHYESGVNIQRRILKELHTRPIFPVPGDQSSTEDDIQLPKKTRRPSRPALLPNLYGSIAKSFSAFDYGQCETQSWTQKYAPKAADEVLQAGTEAQILKSWLQKSTVQSVEAGLGAGRPKPSKSEKPVKRKRKSKTLDNFIVSTEEEDDDMDEITESEDCASPNGKRDLLKKTVIRAGDVAAPGKLTNAVLISGPNGCGKTAAVYAVAKELGFEVFEINSSSRRNGKDILERVGDMTRNHQVHRSSDVPTKTPVDDDEQRMDDALADDLKSGRQGTMNSFFKPKQENKQETKPKPKTTISTKKAAETQKTLFSRTPAKKQKQSLILFEEVDVLYKEDTNFWATVHSLIAISKRPIIMTCNDESVVPILDLTLHAILRFTPPPLDLAVDHMLLVAACEGHVLRREPVKSLYEGRNLDLRASLTDLNFWCQFAVGDVKRGLDWYYPRWSQREDIDEKGNTIRVVSEGTYETGMGWLSQDFLESDIHHLDIEEEMLHEACDGWHVEISDGPKSRSSLIRWAKKLQPCENKSALTMYADFAEAMSSADLCSGRILAPDDQIALDSSLPKLSQKVKDDYILAHEILEATPLVSYDNLSKDIYLWMQSRIRNHLQIDQHVKHNLEVPTELSRLSEGDVIRQITAQATEAEVRLTRKDLSLAFDPVAEPEKLWSSNAAALELCSFDRTTTLITEDLAPYVRSIVAYDGRLQQERTKMSNLLSEGGRPGKKLRTTRAALSALEGGTRTTTRRERWFTGKVNAYHVMRTGMQSWSAAATAAMEALTRAEELTTSSAASPEETNDETCE